MKIQGGNNSPIRPERTNDTRDREQIRREEKNTIGTPERPRDRVEISPAGREKLEKRLENLLDRIRERRGAQIQPMPQKNLGSDDPTIQPIEGQPGNAVPAPDPSKIQPMPRPEPSHEPPPVTIEPIEGRNAQPVEGRNSTDPVGDRHRLQQVRDRLLSGAYDLDHVLSVVARRILDRGDA